MDYIVAGLLFAGLSAIIAALGLIWNAKSVNEQTKTRQINIQTEFLNKLLDLEEKLNELNEKYVGKQLEVKMKQWDSLFFNRIEHLAFLRNRKLFDPEICRFFDDYIVDVYERIFLKHHPKEAVDNPKVFTEFKRYYKEVEK